MAFRWRRIVITDLTVLGRENRVCLAGIDEQTGEFIRPLPYLTQSGCIKRNWHPGLSLMGLFVRPWIERPHIEDRYYCLQLFSGRSLAELDWLALLRTHSFTAIQTAFGIEIMNDEMAQARYIGPEHSPQRSLATLKVAPQTVEVKHSRRVGNRIRVSFIDSAGYRFHDLPVSSLATRRFMTDAHPHLKTWETRVKFQQQLFLRVGLTRYFCQREKCGYWLQVNGLYGFPDFPYGLAATR